MKSRNIYYFTNGSIGDFLMVLFFASLVLRYDPRASVRIITPRNKKIFHDLASRYAVSIYQISSKNLSWTDLMRLFPAVFTVNAVILPATSGILPWQTRYFAWFLSRRIGSGIVNTSLLFNVTTLYTDHMIMLARRLGCELLDPTISLQFEEDMAVLERYHLRSNQYLVVHPRGSHTKRSLDTNALQTIINDIRREYPSIVIIITGSADDRLSIEPTLIGMDRDQVLNLAGSLSIKELVAVIHNAYKYVGVDTGTTHIASFLGVRSLVISHEASLLCWLPYYNKKAEIIYTIHGCPHEIHEGENHARSCYDEEEHYFSSVSLDVIRSSLRIFLTEE